MAGVLNELGEVHDILTLVTGTTVINVFPITTSELVLHVVRVVFLFKLVAGVLSQLVKVLDILICTIAKIVLPTTTSELVLRVVSVDFLFKLVAGVRRQLVDTSLSQTEPVRALVQLE